MAVLAAARPAAALSRSPACTHLLAPTSIHSPTHPTPTQQAEYCERGSVTDVLRAGRVDPAAAAQLGWGRRLSMALDAAKGMM